MSERERNRASIKIDISKESTGAVVEAVADLFSPATEFLGAIGDKIRLYRTTAALRALRRAQDIANDAGIKLTAPPLKFLVPFLEKASLEDQKGKLTEQWARLLVSASTEYDEQLLVFSDVLSQIGPVGAKTIRFLGSKVKLDEAHLVGLRFQLEGFDIAASGWFFRTVILGKRFPSHNLDSDELMELFDERPVMLTDLGIPKLGLPNYSSFSETEYTWGFDTDGALALERLGLMRRGRFEARFNVTPDAYVHDDVEGDYPFSMGYAALTPFGFRFYQKCEASDGKRSGHVGDRQKGRSSKGRRSGNRRP